MEEQNQNWKDVIYEQVPEKENKPKKNKSKKMKHMKLVVGAAIAAGVLVPAVFGSFYQIQEQEQAVLVTFGKPKAVTETGLHFQTSFYSGGSEGEHHNPGFSGGLHRGKQRDGGGGEYHDYLRL